MTGADVLCGGDDAGLVADDLGDTMQGGGGDDEFLVYLEKTVPDAVLVTDFDAPTEILRLFVVGFQPGDLAVTERADGVAVSLGGNPVAVPFDVLAADRPADTIQLLTA